MNMTSFQQKQCHYSRSCLHSKQSKLDCPLAISKMLFKLVNEYITLYFYHTEEIGLPQRNQNSFFSFFYFLIIK